MSKEFDVVLFTDMSTKIYPSRPLGAYRLATELRKNGLTVLVVNFFSKWINDLKNYDNLISKCISDKTCAVGFSSTFFSYENDFKIKVESWQDYLGGDLTPWPDTNKSKIKLLISRIKKKNPDTKIFYGGASADNLSDSLKDVGIDYVVQGLADRSFTESVIRIKNKKLPKFNLKNNLRVIDYDVLGNSFNFPESTVEYTGSDLVRNNEVLSLETSRGCLFHCAFCAFPLLGRNKNHPDYHKNPNSIANELYHNYQNWNTQKYMMVDDTFNESTQKLNSIYKSIRKSGVDIEFSAYIRLDLLDRYPEQIKLLRDMGLRSAFMGIETLHEKAGKAIGKNSYKVIDTLEKIRDIWKDDVVIHGGLIAGLPYENDDTINQWMEWIYQKDYLLQNYNLAVLVINENTSFRSKICQNPNQYGYTFDQEKKWINNVNYTQQDATKISYYWMDKGWKSGRLKLAGWDVMGIQNLGYEFSNLKNLSLKDLNYEKFQEEYSKIVSNYKKELLDFLQK